MMLSIGQQFVLPLGVCLLFFSTDTMGNSHSRRIEPQRGVDAETQIFPQDFPESKPQSESTREDGMGLHLFNVFDDVKSITSSHEESPKGKMIQLREKASGLKDTIAQLIINSQPEPERDRLALLTQPDSSLYEIMHHLVIALDEHADRLQTRANAAVDISGRHAGLLLPRGTKLEEVQHLPFTILVTPQPNSEFIFVLDQVAIGREVYQLEIAGAGGEKTLHFAMRYPTLELVAFGTLSHRPKPTRGLMNLPQLEREFITQVQCEHQILNLLSDGPTIISPQISLYFSRNSRGYLQASYGQQFFSGLNLAEWIRSTLIEEHATEKQIEQRQKEFQFIFRHVLRGIDFAHRRKVIHGDIKPENVLIDFENQRVVLADFGSAFFQENPAELGRLSCDQHRSYGTFWYDSPEIASGDPLALRSFKRDIWAAGITLLEALSATRLSSIAQISPPSIPYMTWNIRLKAALDRKDLSILLGRLADKIVRAPPNSIERLIGDMMSFDPEVRPTAFQTLIGMRAVPHFSEVGERTFLSLPSRPSFGSSYSYSPLLPAQTLVRRASAALRAYPVNPK